MNVSRTVFFLCLVFGVSIAQAKNDSKTTRPDLSGVWRLDGSRSKVDPNVGDITKDYVVTIVHKEPEIRMTTTYQKAGEKVIEESTYYTDGRPDNKPGTGGNGYESSTRWHGTKVVRRTVSKLLGNTRNFSGPEAITIEEWELSADGKTLTLALTFGGVRMAKFRYVFNRTS